MEEKKDTDFEETEDDSGLVEGEAVKDDDAEKASIESADEEAVAEESSQPSKKHHDHMVFWLSLVLLACGVAVILSHRVIDTEMILIILLVCFSFAMSGALMLFYFLSSSAQVKKGVYKIGGAAAGFFILFGLFFASIRDTALYENKLYKIGGSSIAESLLPVAEAYRDIESSNNKAIVSIAQNAIGKTRDIFSDMSVGRYRISAIDLPIYLMPMIENARETYYATQYVLPEKFWEQLWATEYFEKNIVASKDREVDLRRIFILSSSEAKKQKDILDKLMAKHLDNGIQMRIIFKDQYASPEEQLNLYDFVVSDDDITGALALNREGGFTEVEFSTNERLIERRRSQFLRLWALSISYDVWKTKYYDVWARSEG